MSEARKQPGERKVRRAAGQGGDKTRKKKLSLAERWNEILLMGQRLLSSASAPITLQQLQDQSELVTGTVQRLLGGSAHLWLEEAFISGTVDGAARPPASAPAQPTALMQQALSEGRLVQAPGAAAVPVWLHNHINISSGSSPLNTAQLVNAPPHTASPLGVLQVERNGGPPLTATDLNLLEGIAAQAALALQSTRETSLERWRVQQLILVRQVSAQVADVRDLDELSRRITQLILHTFDYYFVAIFTLDPKQDRLAFRASAGPRRPGSQPGEGDMLEGACPLSIHLGEGMVGYAALTGQEILANDVSREPRYRFEDSLPETRSEVALPLNIEDRVLGVLDVQSDQPDDFHDIDLLVLQALAGSIAVAVEGARLYTALSRRASQLDTLSEVSRAITSILNEETLLEEVVSLIHKRFGYPYVHLFSVHPGRRKIFYEAGSGSRSSTFKEHNFTHDLDDPLGLIPWVARHGETAMVNDVSRDERYKPSTLPPEVTHSELTVPLIFGGNILGVLDVQSDLPDAFGEEDRFLFEALADTVAVAMRNAALYRSEAWRRRVADSLREVAGLLSADASLDQVLESILTELERTLPCDLAAIWLLEDEPHDNGRGSGAEGEDTAGETFPLLRLAAMHGPLEPLAELEPGAYLHDIVAAAGEPGQAGLLLVALHSEVALIRSPDSPPEPLGAELGFSSDYSAIATPLKVGDQPLGVLTLSHHTPGRYGAESRSMTAAFASYAAVAIENTRLYEAAHEQAWVSTVLLQVTEATRALTSLEELLSTVVRITPMLVGVQACAVYLLDEEGDFVPAAAAGLSPEQQAAFESRRFPPLAAPALDRLRLEGQAQILPDEEESRPFSEIFSAGGPDGSPFENGLLVLAPLEARGEVLGALLVDYSNTQPASTSLDVLFDERLAILQGITHHTAIAVENIRLLKSQKEEAYVSVALLQVAQAVVSTNSLDDILGSIVRITPILVGVKRAVIFLWDPTHRQFCLAQEYGLPRTVEEVTYPCGAMPLLDAVRQEDALLALPVEQTGLEPPESWQRLPAPTLESSDLALENEPCLLMAFPLSVKGEVLGVLLVEEPEAAPGSASNRRLRSKRLEITTGISQQTALAIQNDRLQREMVERERLEREMQLARDIQRTFLPNSIPTIPGWELDSRWHTAREVGGDFYDFFLLPGNRLGLVIADVADKGMPAALFMTLTRTLLRATVLQVSSPGEVLARVNAALALDAQGGMFVTLFYAVVDLSSGEFTWANGGHNLPLLFRQSTGQLHSLEKGGMALGVFDEIQVTEHTGRLEPGDLLLLYTDGVTEAFSPLGEMYGEESLCQVVESAVARDGSACAVLDAVEDSVGVFLGDALPGDDLTLLALRRSA